MAAIHPYDQAWQRSHYGAVHGALAGLRESGLRTPPPGTEGVIGRAQYHFARTGDKRAAARLEVISTTLFRLRWAQWMRREADLRESVQTLETLAEQWLLEAPMILPEHATLDHVA